MNIKSLIKKVLKKLIAIKNFIKKILKKFIKIPNYEDPSKIWIIDELKALALALMTIYHIIFDLKYIFNIELKNLQLSQITFIKLAFSTILIFISGTIYDFSPNKLKTGTYYLSFGIILTFTNQLLAPNIPVKFGLLHLIGTTALLHSLCTKTNEKIKAKIRTCKIQFDKIALSILGLIFTGNISSRNVGTFKFSIPENWKPYLFPVGIHTENFYSADYFPLFPWAFLFFLGMYFGKLAKQRELPAFSYKLHFKPAAIISKNALLIYLIHQPILIGIIGLVLKIKSFFNK